jgi:hypothetical protein
LEDDLKKYQRTQITPIKNELEGIIKRYKATVEKYQFKVNNYEDVSTTVKQNKASIRVAKTVTFNHCMSGKRIKDLYEILENSSFINASLIIIHVGHNDISSN